MKQYNASTRAIVASAKQLAADRQALGVTREQSAADLKSMLESATGESPVDTVTELYGVLNAIRVLMRWGKPIPADLLPRIEQVLANAEKLAGNHT